MATQEISATTPAPDAIEVFCSYSHKDEELRDDLDKHLAILKRQGVISGWHDRKITAGSEWAGEIDEHLYSAQIILLLISADFLASDYCYDLEMKRAMERHRAGEARVIPVILRPVDWSGTPFGKLQALPKDGRPITSWSNRDEALKDVAVGVRKTLERQRGAKAPRPSESASALEGTRSTSFSEEPESPLHFPRDRKWSKTWWGITILLATAATVSAFILWRVDRHLGKSVTPPLDANLQVIPLKGGSITIGPDRDLRSIDYNGFHIDLPATHESTPTVTSNLVALTPETKRAVEEEVKKQLSLEAAGPNQGGSPGAPPPALDSALNRTFVVDSDVTVVTNGHECALTSGDVLTRLTDTPDANRMVNVEVAASKIGDCAAGQTVAVKVDDLQEMYNHFQAVLTLGMEELTKPKPKKRKGPDGSSAAPGPHVRQGSNFQARDSNSTTGQGGLESAMDNG
jgi:TIR domain